MPLTKRFSLQAKFLMGLTAIMLLMGILFAVSLNFHLRSLMESEVDDKARLILSQVEAVNAYVRTILRPAMYRILPADQFVIEAMSTSYSTRRIMTDLNQSKGQYTYRRVALDPRNPDFAPDAMENRLINFFRANPKVDAHKEMTVINGQAFYVAAKPVVFEHNCLHCHGDPKDAPRELIQMYGGIRGFGRHEGEIGGVHLVRLPVESEVARISDTTLRFIVVFVLGMLCIFAMIQFFFNRLVVHNLRRAAAILPNYFPDEADASIVQKLRHGDEIHDLMRSLEEFAGHLRSVKQELKNYASNLERMVEARTRELAREAGERATDVQLFVSLLNCLNQEFARDQLLAFSLRQIAERFHAARAGYVCAVSAGRSHYWPPNSVPPTLDPDWEKLVAGGQSRFKPGLALVPVLSGDTGRGLLCVEWSAAVELDPQAQEVLRALGQQLGVALENIEAMDSLMRQKDLLESVFEGISDPLALLDGAGSMTLANRSAREPESGPPAGRTLIETLLARSRILPGLLAALETRTGVTTHAEEISLSGNRSFAMNFYPLAGYGRGGGGIVVYAREITTWRRMLNQAQQNEKIIAVGKLAAGLAHEINNPLGVILCYAELLRQGLDGEQQAADLEVIVKHAQSAQKVLKDMLNFARPKPPSSGPCDPGRTAQGLAKVFQVQAQAARIDFSADIAPELPQVAADPASLEQILTNLLINAFDAVSRPGGQVRLSLAPDAHGVTMTVRDNGPGIPAENVNRIFDPFFTTKEVGKGTGLGLWVAYGLVREMGGMIEVENSGGAAFIVRVPANGHPAALTSGQEPAPAPDNANTDDADARP